MPRVTEGIRPVCPLALYQSVVTCHSVLKFPKWVCTRENYATAPPSIALARGGQDGAAAHSAGCWLLAVAAPAGIQEAPARGCRTYLSQALSVGRAYTSTLYASAVCEVPPHTAITGLATNAAWAVATSN